MARELSFVFEGSEFALEPVRLSRRKLYGWKDTVALGPDGDECSLANLDETGTRIIPKGGLGLGLVDSDGQWVERSSLVAVGPDGKEAEKTSSSFEAPIELKDTATPEQFLDHAITAIYTLRGEENCPDFVKAVTEGPIYTFPFAYRDSYDPGTGFLMENKRELFVLVGEKRKFEFVKLEEATAIEEPTENDVDEEEDFDFSMM